MRPDLKAMYHGKSIRKTLDFYVKRYTIFEISFLSRSMIFFSRREM